MYITLKRLFPILLFCCCILHAPAQHKDYQTVIKGDMEFYQYTPETGEGIYSISRRFSVPLTEILRYNPSLEENGLKKGDIVLVPIFKKNPNKYHIIAPKETLYGVSKKYGITSEQLMAANPGINEQTFPIGREIIIPDSSFSAGQPQPATQAAAIYPPQASTDSSPGDRNITEPTGNQAVSIAPGNKKTSYKVALLLPFSSKEVISSGNRYVEYYEGLLLAVDSMKGRGLSLDLYVYDTGLSGQPVSRLLKGNRLDNADLIIGGIDEGEIKELSEFSQNSGVKYIIPFNAKHDDNWMNPNVFQINPAQSLVQTRAANTYALRFRNKNIIFLDWPNDSGNKQKFVRMLKTALDRNQIPYININYSENFGNEIKGYLAAGSENIILPTSSSSEALQSITPSLRILATSGHNITLYGYPEWQVYSKELLEDLFLLNAHFYTTFYANNTSPEIKSFYSKYKYWYHKSLLNTYPKYGLMGFDTGMYFLNALHKYGTAFDQNLKGCTIPSLQMSFNFEQYYDDGSHTNMNLFIVELTPDFILKKSIVQ